MSSLPSPEDLRTIIEAGIGAPSADNCQPWRFSVDGSCLRVCLDAPRGRSSIDVRDAASWISLGATLANMRLSAEDRGYRLDVQLEEEVAAAIRFETVPRRKSPLLAVLSHRCTNRRPYTDSPLPPEVRRELMAVAEQSSGIELDLLEVAGPKRTVADLAARFDQLLFEDHQFHDALYRWIRWTPEESARTRDGLPIASLELHPLEQPGFRLLGRWPVARVGRWLGLTRALPARTASVYRRSSAMGLVSASGAQPADLVSGGETFERIWLTTALQGYALQPLGGLTFLLLRCRLLDGQGLQPSHRRLADQIRQRLRLTLPSAEVRTPVMFFRLGQAKAPTARALRRPVEEALERSLAAKAFAA